jgi:hypothetical protein
VNKSRGTLIGVAVSLMTLCSSEDVNKALVDSLAFAELIEKSQNLKNVLALVQTVLLYE